MITSSDSEGIILVVDDTPANLSVVSSFLHEAGFKVLVAEDANDAQAVIRQTHPDLILLDVLMPAPNGFETCRQLKLDPETSDIPIIFMTALSDTVEKVKGFDVGGVDYITKPFHQEEVLARVKTHLSLRELRRLLEGQKTELQERNRLLQDEIDAHTRTKGTVQYLKGELESEQIGKGVVGNSRTVRETLEQVTQAAETDCTVLIIGETGTGKEVFARTVHEQSQRVDMPLIKVNCAAIPKDLFESEFFGHEKGAFTGALAKRIGRFELADRGTLFLDEIGELPLDIQGKLLRVLQEQEFERIGSQNTQKVDVRIIAATNRDLHEDVAQKRFREDLYYRLHVFPVHIPPLRDRLDDLPLLVEHFLKKFSAKHRKVINSVHEESMRELLNYAWPGNIRELENVMERAVIISKGPKVKVGEWFEKQTIAPNHSAIEPPPPCPSPETTGFMSLEDVERLHILRALDATKWRISGEKGAAQLLGVNRSTLRGRMEKLGIVREE